MRAPLLLSAGCFVLAMTQNAHSYVCTPASANANITQAWTSRCIPYGISSHSALFNTESRRGLVNESFEVWTSTSCTDLEFLFVTETDQGEAFDPDKPYENLNVITSIDTRAYLNELVNQGIWRNGLLALTFVHHSANTAEIIDADVMFNNVEFTFDDLQPSTACTPQAPIQDLRNALVHEIGHVIGLDHTPIEGATMFADAMPCEIKKRDLSDDDVEGVCSIYPRGQTTQTCKPPPDGYDLPGEDFTPYRNQCNRFLNPDIPQTGEPGGCSCRTDAAPEARDPFSFLMGLLGLSFLVFRRRRHRRGEAQTLIGR